MNPINFEKDYLQHAHVYTISLPKGGAWDTERAHSLMEHLAHELGKITFRIVAESDRIVWQLLDMRILAEPSFITRCVLTFYPEAEVDVSRYSHPELPTPAWRWVDLYRLTGDHYVPIKYVSDLKHSDPMDALVQAMSGLEEGERIIYTLHIQGVADAAEKKRLKKKVTRSTLHPLRFLSYEGIGSVIADVTMGQTRTSRYVPEQQKLFENRLNYHTLYNAYLMLQVDGPDGETVAQRVDGLASILFNQFGSDFNAFVRLTDETAGGVAAFDFQEIRNADDGKETSIIGLMGAWAEGRDQSHARIRALLSTWELASLWHLPHQGCTASEIGWSAGRRVRAAAALLKNREGVLIGDNVFAGKQSPIYLRDGDRDSHINIVGKTKVGKSTLMHNLIHQDIASGKGVGVVDPHGKLVSDILRASIPDERMDDVVVIDIANEAYPPPLNPIAVPGRRGRAAAGRVMAVLDKIYGGFGSTPRIADTLSAALVTLWLEETPTVRDVTRLFDNLEYRYSLLNQLDDLVTEEFWDRFGNLSPSRQDELAYPVVYRMRNFYGNPSLYPVMCHPDALDLAGLIRDGKVVLVSLRADEEKVPPREQRLLGAVIVSQLQMAAMKSGAGAGGQDGGSEGASRRPPFHLYIDEAQAFVTTALDEMFPEARKFGLYLTVAHQFLGQLRGKTLESVMGNVGTTIVFQTGPDDARALAPYYGPEFGPEDLMNLDLHEAAVKMRLGGQTLPAYGLATRPKPGDTDSQEAKEREASIRQRSIERYTPKAREEVLGWLKARYARPKFRRPPGEGAEGQSEDWVVSSA